MKHQQKMLALLLAGIGLGLGATPAGAATSTFVFNNPAVVGGNGSLDVASQLPSGNVATFTAGSLSFSFSAQAGAPAFQYNNTTPFNYSYSNSYYVPYSYCCGFSTCYSSYLATDNYYSSNNTNYYSTPAQSAQVTVGGATASSSAPASTANIATRSSSFSNYNGSGYDYYSTYYYDNTTTIGGSFSALLALDSTALAALNSTGFLGFGLSTIGNVTLNQVSFTGDYNLASAPAPVPEPETYAMLLAGLGLLGFTARRRKRAA